jgi:hypothetical protein
MGKRSGNLSVRATMAKPSHLIAIALAVCLVDAAGRRSNDSGAERAHDEPLRVAVYDVPPFGSVDAGGWFSGASVDLWRRVAEDLHLTYRFIAVAQMADVISGVERGQFDAAIGAITITPDRLARVEFTYPSHRSGVAVALPKQTGPIAAVMSYVAVVKELGPLIVLTLGLLMLIGALMWVFERKRRLASSWRARGHIAIRRHLLGGRHHDHSRLRRCDATNAGRAIHCRTLDAGEPDSHIPADNEPRRAHDRRRRHIGPNRAD